MSNNVRELAPILSKLLDSARDELFCGDIWVNVESDSYKDGLFVQVESKELENGEFSDDTYTFTAYRNFLNSECALETDYSEAVYVFDLKLDYTQDMWERAISKSDFLRYVIDKMQDGEVEGYVPLWKLTPHAMTLGKSESSNIAASAAAYMINEDKIMEKLKKENGFSAKELIEAGFDADNKEHPDFVNDKLLSIDFSDSEKIKLGEQVSSIFKLKYNPKEEFFNTNYGKKTLLGIGNMTTDLIDKYKYDQKTGKDLTASEAEDFGKEAIERFGLKIKRDGKISTTWAESTSEGVGRMVLNIYGDVCAELNEPAAGAKKESVADIAAGAGNVSADGVTEEVRKMSGSKTPSLSQG